MLVEVSIFGDVQFSRELTRVGDRGANMNPVFRSTFDHITEINAAQILSQGSRGGTPWKPLKQATIDAKTAAGNPHPERAEVATEDLFNALSHLGDENSEAIYNDTWAVWRVTGDPGEYGPAQHWGSADGSLPARPLFRLTNMDRKEILDEWAYFLFKGVVRNFVV